MKTKAHPARFALAKKKKKKRKRRKTPPPETSLPDDQKLDGAEKKNECGAGRSLNNPPLILRENIEIRKKKKEVSSDRWSGSAPLSLSSPLLSPSFFQPHGAPGCPRRGVASVLSPLSLSLTLRFILCHSTSFGSRWGKICSTYLSASIIASDAGSRGVRELFEAYLSSPLSWGGGGGGPKCPERKKKKGEKKKKVHRPSFFVSLQWR